MARNPERNDSRKAKKQHQNPHARHSFRRGPDPVADDLIWGWHAVEAALGNPARGPALRLLATEDRARQIEARFGKIDELEIADAAAIAKLVPTSAVHQGVVLKPSPLPDVELESFEATPGAVLLMLDQVTDPQNVGAILRSCAAFGASGLIVQDRHSPKLSGALAKAAAGAVERTPVAHVVNLSRALEALAELGWRAVGLSGEAERDLEPVLDGGPVVLVLGSEGEGLRRLVAEHCDELARIPMPGGFESLNVSAAAAVALYEARRPRT